MVPIRQRPPFVHNPAFDEDWHDAGLGDEELRELCERLVADPASGDPVEGAGGLRKTRVALPGRGKRGGARVGYAAFPAYGVIYLVLVYPKSEEADLSAADRRSVAAELVEFEELLAFWAARRAKAKGRTRRG
ncbi:MAG: type II toxin-antitoxin system RelE/ParE family toxin [Gemmataceae bacterium]|nr:type II toxin-antitoxin system RelE/ParE family toxin [Gemmataceae bacterium]